MAVSYNVWLMAIVMLIVCREILFFCGDELVIYVLCGDELCVLCGDELVIYWSCVVTG